MIKIITIDREYGSGAADIAATLAARLGWKLWDELLTVEIARGLGCDCTVVEPLDRPAEGNILVCCSQPIRDVVIDLWIKSTSLTKCRVGYSSTVARGPSWNRRASSTCCSGVQVCEPRMC